MVYRLISHGLNAIVLGLITLTSGGALLLGYRGLLELLGGHAMSGCTCLAIGAPVALGAALLIINKDDLMDK